MCKRRIEHIFTLINEEFFFLDNFNNSFYAQFEITFNIGSTCLSHFNIFFVVARNKLLKKTIGRK